MRYRVRALVVSFIAALAVLPAGAASAISTPTLQAKLTREMHHAGGFSGAFVRDLDIQRTLFEVNADAPRAPASVEKLYTTASALMRFGPDATLATTVAGRGFLDPDGVWRGDLYLHGGGDPTLGGDDLQRLSRAVGAAGIVRVDGSILGDESRFDLLRGSFDTGGAYDRDIGGVLSALALNRGFSKDGRPAAQAAGQFAKILRGDGIRVEGRSGAGTAPAQADELASVASPPVRDLIRLTNVPSDNFLAEMLIKDLGAEFAGAGTTAAGVGVVRTQLNAFGLTPRVVDGSGLSRADRTTPRQVVHLLEAMHGQDVAGAFEGSLAVAGRTGTIRKRMRGTAAQDRCRAKTGTLIGVSALAGLCASAGGHTIAFAMLMNRTSVARAHGVQDRAAAAIARYNGT
ncbi:MAG TPA: D-alanyl-D-alanine carboxypeptidase/D-alanyl-D-alanine-endopeptidase [Solirubrobacteraceae bacterium]|nr:D-alanyl-D-alanine carboxypeptidase/D-alanyl-D-alanine-endopeptidase [Solirubrobacteraceae bacterium]